MKRLICTPVALVLLCGLAWPAPPQAATPTVFTGIISDSMCGLKHNMQGDAKACTVTCVQRGATYVLADAAHNRVYRLSNQRVASRFPGQSVVVKGRERGDIIMVYNMELAK